MVTVPFGYADKPVIIKASFTEVKIVDDQKLQIKHINGAEKKILDYNTALFFK